MSTLISPLNELEPRAVSLFWDPTSPETTATKKQLNVFTGSQRVQVNFSQSQKLLNVVPVNAVNYSPCYKRKEPVLVACMTGLPSGTQAWFLAHHKAATEGDVENFCCAQAVPWSCPAAWGLCWCCTCCSYLAASFFFKQQVFLSSFCITESA